MKAAPAGSRKQQSYSPVNINDDSSVVPRSAFAGGLLFDGINEDGSKSDVDPFLQKGSVVAIVAWGLLLSIVYQVAPEDSFERLEGTEQNANAAVLILLLYTNISRMMQLFVRDKGLAYLNTSVMFGSITVQLIAILSICLMMFFPTPVVVDEITGMRCHLVRWVEWVVLAFLMTFLTESIDMHSQGVAETAIAWIHGIAIGLSTAAGGIFPFCKTQFAWMSVFVVAWFLFCTLFVRLYQRYRKLRSTPIGITVEEKEEYDRAKYSFKTIAICAVAWTSLALAFSFVAMMKKYADPESILASDSVVLVQGNFFEIISKVWYCSILIEIHDVIFDGVNRSMRRLEQLRSFASSVWENSSDVMVWCSQDKDQIHGIVSPAFFNIHMIPRPSTNAISSTLFIELDTKNGTYKTCQINLSENITRDHAIGALSTVSKRTIGATTCDTCSAYEKNIAVVVNLLGEIFRLKPSGETLLKTLFACNSLQEETKLRYEAKMTNLDFARLIVLRDISERIQRFETEKRILKENTERAKDAEANTFTRHEVKNGILASIGVLESLKKSSSRASAGHFPRSDETLDRILGRQGEAEPSTFEEGMEELEERLRFMLDTVMDHAMSKEVIYDQYIVCKETIDVPDLLSSICTFSKSSRFSLELDPSDFPKIEIDPRLLRFIYQNALSNACRYGSPNGDIATSIRYDASQSMFRMDVENAPGYGHQKLVAMTPEDVNARVFAQKTSLHSIVTRDGSIAKSTGDGAWIMKKCATVLQGDCNLQFKEDRTVFTFWCPAIAEDRPPTVIVIDEANIDTLPDNTFAICIDDSKIQRKLLDQQLKYSGLPKEKRLILGANAEEIYGFERLVVELVEKNKTDRFLIIADENLEVFGPGEVDTVSGSRCLQKILQQLSAEDNNRILALVRSADDAPDNLLHYKSRAHGHLLKKRITEKSGLMKDVLPLWNQRFPKKHKRRYKTRRISTTDADDYDPSIEIKGAVEVVDAIYRASDVDHFNARWGTIKAKLQTLKGDLKTFIRVADDDSIAGIPVIRAIDNMRRLESPMDFIEAWPKLKYEINFVLNVPQKS